MTVVAYMTHPLGERDAGEGIQRGDNLAAAVEWLRFLKDATRWAICCPWFAYVAALDDAFRRPSWLTDQVEILSRCDLVVAVGGHLSGHMRIELEHARLCKVPIPVLDLLDLGRFAPWPGTDRLAQEVLRRAEALGIE